MEEGRRGGSSGGEGRERKGSIEGWRRGREEGAERE